jgi:hypothetical protein
MEDVLWHILHPTGVTHCGLFCYWPLLLAYQGCRGQCLTRHHTRMQIHLLCKLSDAEPCRSESLARSQVVTNLCEDTNLLLFKFVCLTRPAVQHFVVHS